MRPFRSYFAAIAVSLVVASLLIGSAPVEARLRKVALGLSMPEGNGSVSALNSVFDRFTEDVGGNRPAIWTLWSTWGEPGSREFPTELANFLNARGATPFIFWVPALNGGSCEYAQHKLIAAGNYDKYIKRWARAAKAYGHAVLLRYAQEMNGKYFPWGNGRCGNTVRDFLRGWRHVYKIFQNAGASNVKFVWTVAKQSCRGGCNPYEAWYPGNKFVQYVGFSSFNWGAMKSQWNPMALSVGAGMRSFQEFTSKPVIVAELATARDGGPAGDPQDKSQWIREGYPAVYKKWPKIKAIVYLNVDLRDAGHPDWSLNAPNPEAHQAYGWVAAQARFKGKIN